MVVKQILFDCVTRITIQTILSIHHYLILIENPLRRSSSLVCFYFYFALGWSAGGESAEVPRKRRKLCCGGEFPLGVHLRKR